MNSGCADRAVPHTSPAGKRGPDRLAFLDALRGIAASLVVLEHALGHAVPGYTAFAVRYFDMGQFGVCIFLLISGYIIPVSLERGGSNARFWVNRFLRLFPLYWASVGFFFALHLVTHSGEVGDITPWLVNLTMLQEFFRVPHVSGVFCTLTLELLFYFACSTLYCLNLLSWTRTLVWLGQAGLLGLGVIFPLVSGRRFPGGYAFLFLTMFVGTAFYRHSRGEMSRRALTLLLACLAIVALPVSYVNFAMFAREGLPFTFHCVYTFWLAAYLTFMIALRARHRHMPAVLCYLGRIS